jgi:hypothetical protein
METPDIDKLLAQLPIALGKETMSEDAEKYARELLRMMMEGGRGVLFVQNGHSFSYISNNVTPEDTNTILKVSWGILNPGR